MIAAAEIAGTYLPYDIATGLHMVVAETALAGIVGKVAQLSAAVQRQYGVLAERSKAHGRYIKYTCRIRLCTCRATNGDTRIIIQHAVVYGIDAVAEPFVAGSIYIELCTEGRGIIYFFCTTVYEAAVYTIEGRAIGIAFYKILVQLRAYLFEDKPHVAEHREVAQYAVV